MKAVSWIFNIIFTLLFPDLHRLTIVGVNDMVVYLHLWMGLSFLFTRAALDDEDDGKQDDVEDESETR